MFLKPVILFKFPLQYETLIAVRGCYCPDLFLDESKIVKNLQLISFQEDKVYER